MRKAVSRSKAITQASSSNPLLLSTGRDSTSGNERSPLPTHTRFCPPQHYVGESRASRAGGSENDTERERTGQAAAAVGQRRSADLAVASVVHLVGAVKVHLAEVRVAKDAGSDAAPDRVDVVARGEHAEAAHALARLDLSPGKRGGGEGGRDGWVLSAESSPGSSCTPA